MVGQLAIVLLIVAAAIGYMAWGVLRAWRGKSKGGGSCSCPARGEKVDNQALIPAHALQIKPPRTTRPSG